MNKLQVVFAIVVGLLLISLLTYGTLVATRELSHMIATGIGNIYSSVE